MATQATLSDVIEQLRVEGQLTRDTGDNSIKSLGIELNFQTDSLKEMLRIMQAQEARAQLAKVSQDRGTGAPVDAASPAPSGPVEPVNTNGILDSLLSFSRLGLLAKGAALAIGVALGIVKGELALYKMILPKTTAKVIKAMNSFGNSITTTFNAITKSITQGIKSAGITVVTKIADFGKWIGGLFSRAGTAINQLGRVGNFFTGTMSSITDAISRISKAFSNVAKTITGTVKTALGLGKKFAAIMGPITKFSGTILKISSTVAKIFPIFRIVLAAFDTIKGFITGFTEGGIMGGIKGAIVGLMSSLVTGPLDLLKGAVAWILEKLGFDSAAEFLNSFSFTELYTKMVNGIFEFLEKAWDWIKLLFTDPKAALTAGWKLITGGVENLGGWILGKVEGVWNWITGIFSNLADMLPSMEELRTTILNLMPDWMRKMVGAPERTAGEIVNEKMQENKAELEEARARVALSESGGNAYSMFTTEESGREKDKETIARLSATVDATNPEIATIDQTLNTLRSERATLFQNAEAARDTSGIYVEPDTTALDASIAENEALKATLKAKLVSPDLLQSKMPSAAISSMTGDYKEFDYDAIMAETNKKVEAYQAYSNLLESRALQGGSSPTIVVNAPTVAPVNNNVTGPTNVSNQRVTSIGTGSGMSGLGRFAN